ncbi:hypothetical protein BGW38_005689, partial [Lunasporangiospora selenospora]
MSNPVRGSSLTSGSHVPHPNVTLAPLPLHEDPQQNADYDPYASELGAENPRPLKSPTAASYPSSNWSHPDGPPRSPSEPLHSNHHYIQDYGASGAPSSLDLDLSGLSLEGPNNSNGVSSHLSGGPRDDMNSLPLHLSDDSQERKPLERSGYADDSRHPESEKEAAGQDENEGPALNAFEPGVAVSEGGQAPQRTASVDSTHSTVRAYAAANPNGITYTESSSSHGVGGAAGAGPDYQGYNGSHQGGYGQEYGYGGPEYGQNPSYRGPPSQQNFGQHPDPRYRPPQQYPGYGGSGGYSQPGYQDPQYDAYGQPYGSEYGQDYYQDQQYQQQQHYGGGYGGPGSGYEYGGGYRPQ